MGMEEFTVSMTNRSLRSIKTELDFLAENDIIDQAQLSSILSQLPDETSFGQSRVPVPSLPTRNNQNTSYNDEKSHYNDTQSHNPPPAYTAPPSAGPAVLTHAVALYDYKGTDDGDLSMQTNDRIAVHEYLNADWWKGRNDRTGRIGIFPQSYIRRDERAAPPPPPASYGNVPVEVAEQPQKGKGTLGKVGGKLGNAAIFGAGATIGGNIVNSIF